MRPWRLLWVYLYSYMQQILGLCWCLLLSLRPLFLKFYLKKLQLLICAFYFPVYLYLVLWDKIFHTGTPLPRHYQKSLRQDHRCGCDWAVSRWLPEALLSESQVVLQDHRCGCDCAGSITHSDPRVRQKRLFCVTLENSPYVQTGHHFGVWWCVAQPISKWTKIPKVSYWEIWSIFLVGGASSTFLEFKM